VEWVAGFVWNQWQPWSGIRNLTKQVEWSIFSGHLSDEKYENDQKRLKIALRLIKNEEWSKPSGMPKVYC
jgi:hypothetical protein